MDIQTLILDYMLSERTGIILLLAASVYYIYGQNKIQSRIEAEIKGVKEKVNKLVNRTEDTS